MVPFTSRKMAFRPLHDDQCLKCTGRGSGFTREQGLPDDKGV